MFFDNGIENLCDDGFEGSTNERRIFSDIFFGDHAVNNGEGRLPGALSFECSKNVDSSMFSSSGYSAITSQSPPKALCLPEPVIVNYNGRGNSSVRCYSDGFSMEAIGDPHAFIEQIKLPDEKPSGTVIDEKCQNSSIISYESIYGSSPGADSIFQTVTFPLVESLHQGVAWNYFLLRQNVPGVQADRGIVDVLNGQFLGSDGNLEEFHACSRSPVSQESYATRLLIASQPPNPEHKLEYAALEDAAAEVVILGVDTSSVVKADASKDPRPLLFSGALDLLKSAGWLVTKHKRPSRNHLEYKYRSPTGRSYREFSKVWIACGALLLGDRFVVVQQDDDQGWNDISLFFSSTYDALTSVKKEHNHSDVTGSLIHQWNILNPFVTVIFIDKKIGMLRKGEFVKVKHNLLIDKCEKRNVVLGLSRASHKDAGVGIASSMNCRNVGVNKLAQRHLSVPDSCPAQSNVRLFDDQNGKREIVMGLKCRDADDLQVALLALKNGDVDMNKACQEQLSVPAPQCNAILCNSGLEKRDTVLGLKCGDFKASLLFGGQFPSLFADWSQPLESHVRILDGKADASSVPSHGDYFLQSDWLRTEETARYLPGSLGGMPAVNGNCLLESGTDIQGRLFHELNDRSPSLALDADGANALTGPCNDLFTPSGSVYSIPDPLAICFPHSNDMGSSVSHDQENVQRHAGIVEDMPIVACETDDLIEDQGTDKMCKHLPILQSNHANCPDSCGSIGCKPCKFLSENDFNGAETPVFRTTDITEKSGNCAMESHRCRVVEVILKKKTRRRSKKISDIKSAALHQAHIIGETSGKAEPLDVDTSPSQLELDGMLEDLEAEAKGQGRCKSSSVSFSLHQVHIGRVRHKKIHQHCDDIETRKKRLRKCEIDDDDLLVSAIIKNKEAGSAHSGTKPKRKGCKSRVIRMMKSKAGRCRLLPRQLGKSGSLSLERSSLGRRSVLSWLINSGIISPEDVIQYRDPKSKALVKDGRITTNGIICNCCNEVLSLTQFKIHAGFKLNRPCLNLFMESGEPLTLCKLQAWSSEYKSRKTAKLTFQPDDNDQNDDSCGLCGDGGELICCDNCPSTFHQACLLTEDLPEGNWYCNNCTCHICGCLVNVMFEDARKCSQCERKYHESCMTEKTLETAVSDAWFCGRSCWEVHSGLHSRVGLINYITDGFAWALLRCIHDDQKVHSAQRFALKAECNSKLAVALSIVEECFASMVDQRTGIDMIPHILYNWGSEFARLNFQGFYTMVLEKDDVLITAASVRLHGVAVAEMPLIATCSKYRRQGLCRLLMTALEELLISLKVEKLVIAAIPELVETWIKGFGFEIVEKDEKQSLKEINLMVFPGTILLKKSLFPSHNTDSERGNAGSTMMEMELAEGVSEDSSAVHRVSGKDALEVTGSKSNGMVEESKNMEQAGSMERDEEGLVVGEDEAVVVRSSGGQQMIVGGPKVVLGLSSGQGQVSKVLARGRARAESACKGNASVSPYVYGIKQVSFPFSETL